MARVRLEDAQARFNHIAKVYGKNASEAIPGGTARAREAAEAATPVVSGFLLSRWAISDIPGGKELVNDAEYAVPVDIGSATNEPRGMTAAALAAFRRHVRNFKVLKGI
jgi:hypothetical protein